jgi:phosphoribosylformylglycinamidine cyclo-ligase
VDRPKLLDGPRDVRPGDAVVGVASTGLHSNGYSLARKALLEVGRLPLDGPAEGLGRTLGDELLEPTAIYVSEVEAFLASGVRALAHITGGGLLENLPRVLPAGVVAELDRSAWTVPPIFRLIQRHGAVAEHEMVRTFNMGIGLVAVLPPQSAESAIERIGDRARRIGWIRPRTGGEAQVSLGL